MTTSPLFSAEGTIFSYGRSAQIYGCDGYGWGPRSGWHNSCPYCCCNLTDQGSFHIGGRPIGKRKDNPSATGFCFECGHRSAAIDPSDYKEEDDILLYAALCKTPGIGCFIRVATCSNCGWWYAIERGTEAIGDQAPVYHGILHEFELGAMSIPLEVLRTELPKQLDKIAYLHPNRFEDLVANILAGVFDCEVRQLGYTRDGGIDLLVLNSNTPVAVQVKRRGNLAATERVSGVREFLGAGLLQEYQHLMYVTTASRFSKDATLVAQKSEKLGLVQKFELLDITMLTEILRSWKNNSNWIHAIEHVVREKRGMPYTADPYQFA
jgi:Restriction endonuclease